MLYISSGSDEVFQSMIEVGFKLNFVHLVEPHYNTKTGWFVAKMGTPADLLKLQEKERHDKNIH